MGQRRKLELQPRSGNEPVNSSEAEIRPASIFGAAKPVDTSQREKEVAAKKQAASRGAIKGTRLLLSPIFFYSKRNVHLVHLAVAKRFHRPLKVDISRKTNFVKIFQFSEPN